MVLMVSAVSFNSLVQHPSTLHDRPTCLSSQSNRTIALFKQEDTAMGWVSQDGLNAMPSFTPRLAAMLIRPALAVTAMSLPLLQAIMLCGLSTKADNGVTVQWVCGQGLILLAEVRGGNPPADLRLLPDSLRSSLPRRYPTYRCG